MRPSYIQALFSKTPENKTPVQKKSISIVLKSPWKENILPNQIFQSSHFLLPVSWYNEQQKHWGLYTVKSVFPIQIMMGKFVIFLYKVIVMFRFWIYCLKNPLKDDPYQPCIWPGTLLSLSVFIYVMGLIIGPTSKFFLYWRPHN